MAAMLRLLAVLVILRPGYAFARDGGALGRGVEEISQTAMGRSQLDGGAGAVAAVALRGPDAPSLDLPSSNSELAGNGEELNLGWTLFRTALVLGIVIALVYLTLNVGLRKLLGIKPSTSRGLVTVLERVALDQKRSLFVVKAGGEVLLLGGSDASLSLIAKLDAAEVERQQVHASPVITMSPMLEKLLGSRKKS